MTLKKGPEMKLLLKELAPVDMAGRLTTSLGLIVRAIDLWPDPVSHSVARQSILLHAKLGLLELFRYLREAPSRAGKQNAEEFILGFTPLIGEALTAAQRERLGLWYAAMDTTFTLIGMVGITDYLEDEAIDILVAQLKPTIGNLATVLVSAKLAWTIIDGTTN